jgi:hypothetical protein
MKELKLIQKESVESELLAVLLNQNSKFECNKWSGLPQYTFFYP